MTLVQEATEIMQKMPEQNQRVVVDLLKIMTYNINIQPEQSQQSEPFKRTGRVSFDLPPGFDEHFDDANDEIAAMFYGE